MWERSGMITVALKHMNKNLEYATMGRGQEFGRCAEVLCH